MIPKDLKDKLEENGRVFLISLGVVVMLFSVVIFFIKLNSKISGLGDLSGKKIEVDFSFINSNLFKSLEMFSPSELPEEKGRSYPFEPYIEQ